MSTRPAGRWLSPRAAFAAIVGLVASWSCEPGPTEPPDGPSVRLRIVEPTLAVSSYLGDSIEVQLLLNDTLLAAPTGGVTLEFLSREPSCVGAPAPTLLEAGLSSRQVKVNYGCSAAVPCSTYLVLVGNVITPGDSVLVTATNAPRIELPDTLVLAQGLQTTFQGGLAALNAADVTPRPAPPIRFRSLDSSIVRLADDHATASAGSIEALTVAVHGSGTSGVVSITVHATSGSSGQSTRVVASGVGFRPDTVVVRVVPVAVSVHVTDLAHTIPTSGGAPAELVWAGIGTDTSASGTPAIRPDVVRFGGAAVSVSFVNVDAAVADMQVGTAGAGSDSIVVGVPELGYRTPDEGPAAYFRPVSGGTTHVRARITGQATGAVESPTITVTGPDTTTTRHFLSTGPMHIGAGLQGPRSVRVGILPAGGIDFTVRALDAGKLLFAGSEGELGTAIGGAHVDPGEPDAFATFHLRALEGLAGDTVPIVMEAPTFFPETIAVIIGAPEFSFFPPALSSYPVGYTNAANLAFRVELAERVRLGGSSIQVTVVNEGAAFADLTDGTTTGDALVLTFGPGDYLRMGSLIPVSDGVLLIRASAPGLTPLTAISKQITIAPAPPPIVPKLQLDDDRRIGFGMHGPRRVALPHPAAAGGVRVSVWTDRSGKITLGRNASEEGLDSIVVEVGDTLEQTSYYVAALEGSGSDTAVVYAAADGYRPDTARIIRVGRILEMGRPSPILRAAPNTPLIVSVRSSTDTYASADRIRQGGPAVGLIATSSAPAVGRLVTATDTAATVSVLINPGTSSTGSALLFDPLSVGSTTITVSSPGFAQISTTADVTQPTLFVQNWIAITNQVQHRTVILSAANHGGTPVTLRSADPSMVLLSQEGGPIADSIMLTIPDGATTAAFTLHGQPNAYGSTNVFATSPIATGDTATMQVRTAGIEFIALDTILPEQGLAVAVNLRRGFLTADSSRVELPAVVLNFAPVVTATVTSSVPAVVGLKQGDAAPPAATGTATFNEEATTALFVWPTGLLLKPLQNGTTVLTVTAPGWLTAKRTGVRPVVVYP